MYLFGFRFQVIGDYKTPAEKDFSRGFEVLLAEIMTYLINCRPASVSMTNAVKYLKSHLTQLPNNISDHEVSCRNFRFMIHRIRFFRLQCTKRDFASSKISFSAIQFAKCYFGHEKFHFSPFSLRKISHVTRLRSGNLSLSCYSLRLGL